MNEHPRPRPRRKRTVRGGVLLAGAAAVTVTAGFLTACSPGSSGANSAAPPHAAVTVKGQSVDLESDQCAELHAAIANGGSVDENTARGCDQTEKSAATGGGGRAVESLTCHAINARTSGGDLGFLAAALEIQCAEEEAAAGLAASAAAASLCVGAQKVADGGGQVNQEVGEFCGNVRGPNPTAS